MPEFKNIHDAVKNHEELEFEPRDCEEPTDVLPGPAKLEELIRRAEQGQSLWHPEDRQFYEEDED